MNLPVRRGLCLLVVALLGASHVGVSQSEAPLIDFTFDQVDVATFVKLVGEITGRRFVVGDDIKGKVTIVSPKVPPDQVYPLFVTILESVGCSVLVDGDVHRVVPVSGEGMHLATVIKDGEQTPEHGVVTKILRIQHVTAGDLRRALAPTKEGGAATGLATIDETNHLIITGSAPSVRRIERIVAEIDQPGASRMTEVVSLKYASAEDLADQLNAAMSETQSRADRLRSRLSAGVNTPVPSVIRAAMAVPAQQSNSLILVGSQVQIAALQELIVKMDVDAPSGRGRLNAIFLRYLSAEEAAKNIGALLDKSAARVSKEQAHQIAIHASPPSNALLVDASPGDFDVVRKLVDQLDQMPQQVQVDVIIMEVSRSDGFELGIELAAVELPSSVGDTVVQGSFGLADGASGLLNAIQTGIFPKGLSVGVAHGSRAAADGSIVPEFPALFNIDASKREGRFKVISETSLQAQNNKEATVEVVNQIPILKSTIAGGTGSARDVIQNIDRIDVGIKLTFTPHIVPNGDVSMDLNPTIEAVMDPGPDAQGLAPTIARRSVKTTVSVEDGRTIVIAGLTREDDTKIEKRVPFFGAIPVLGWLFRNTTTVKERKDMLILVTPHVVQNMATADALKAAAEERTGLSAPKWGPRHE